MAFPCSRSWASLCPSIDPVDGLQFSSPSETPTNRFQTIPALLILSKIHAVFLNANMGVTQRPHLCTNSAIERNRKSLCHCEVNGRMGWLMNFYLFVGTRAKVLDAGESFEVTSSMTMLCL